MRFVELTELDGDKIVVNAQHIVELHYSGEGSTAIFIDDNVGIDVRESPDQILSLINGEQPSSTNRERDALSRIVAILDANYGVAESWHTVIKMVKQIDAIARAALSTEKDVSDTRDGSSP